MRAAALERLEHTWPRCLLGSLRLQGLLRRRALGTAFSSCERRVCRGLFRLHALTPMALPWVPVPRSPSEACAELARSGQWPDTRRAQAAAPLHLAGTARNGVREAPAQPPTHSPFCMRVVWTSPLATVQVKPAMQAVRPASFLLRSCPGWVGAVRRVGVRRMLTKESRGMSSAAV